MRKATHRQKAQTQGVQLRSGKRGVQPYDTTKYASSCAREIAKLWCMALTRFPFPDEVFIGEKSNVAPQPLPEAEARNERTLEAVGCRRLLAGLIIADARRLRSLISPAASAAVSIAFRDFRLRPIQAHGQEEWPLGRRQPVRFLVRTRRLVLDVQRNATVRIPLELRQHS